MLRVTGFKPEFVNHILDCVTLVSVVVSWNEEILEPFKSFRGLRQGDLLSPYLFVLGMEVLSQQTMGAVEDGSGATVNIKCGGPKLSHFFFVDDLLLFREASFFAGKANGTCLARFCCISSKQVNCEKSRIFSLLIPSIYLNHAISSEFHISTTLDLGSYSSWA